MLELSFSTSTPYQSNRCASKIQDCPSSRGDGNAPAQTLTSRFAVAVKVWPSPVNLTSVAIKGLLLGCKGIRSASAPLKTFKLCHGNLDSNKYWQSR